MKIKTLVENILYEATAIELLNDSVRQIEVNPKQAKLKAFSYRKQLAIFNVGKYLQKVKFVDLKLVRNKDDRKAIDRAIDGHIKVFCTCNDFLYGGYKYMADEFDYGTNQERRYPSKNNPNLRGSICKHLTYLLPQLKSFAEPILKDINLSKENNYKTIKHK